MEFSEKLQQLRKHKGMTQEQLATRLYVSRTAISKWETGGGYPNLESLKDIARVFEVSIDDLLSGEEIVNLADAENSANTKRFTGIVFGMFDLIMLSFFFLPLFGEQQGAKIEMVSLLRYAGPNYFLFIFSSLFCLLSLIGVIELVSALKEKEHLCRRAMLCSIVVHSLAVLAFIMTREPYVAGFLFVLLIAKLALLLALREKKRDSN